MERYIDTALMRNEKLISFARPHWIIFGSAVSTLILALLVCLFGPSISYLTVPVFRDFTMTDIVSGLLLIVGIYWFITAYIGYRTTEYAVTDKRVIMKRGFIRRDSLELFLRKLEAVNVNQTVTGRIFNYGTVIIIGTGGTQDYYPLVTSPMEFRRIVQREVDRLVEGPEDE